MNQLLLRKENLKSEELKIQVSNAAKESWRFQWQLFPHQFTKILQNIAQQDMCERTILKHASIGIPR